MHLWQQTALNACEGQRYPFCGFLSGRTVNGALLPIVVIFQTELLEWLTQMLDLSLLFSDVTTHFFFFLLLTYMCFEKSGNDK